MTPTPDPFALMAEQLLPLLDTDKPLLPELETPPGDLANAPQTRVFLRQTAPLMETLAAIPQTRYTDYRQFVRNGDRSRYETPYFAKRINLTTAVLRLFLGVEASLDGSSGRPSKDLVQDYLWDICEESSWVVPAHEDRIIDLFAAETGFALAETLALLGDTLDAEVRHRVRTEVERRIFNPYLRFHRSQGWYKGHNNWNGVCNSSVAATFLRLEPEPGRVARALEIALAGLRVFLDNAFESDGSSTEGVSYWHYGLVNFVTLAEMLRARSGGAVDLLASEHLRRVAAYPAKMRLSGAHFASFSDCDETVTFNPGILQRLAERTGEDSLRDLPVFEGGRQFYRLPIALRNLLWWDGDERDDAPAQDATLPVGGVAKRVATTRAGVPVVMAVKAGHNDEHHNQNDVGSFIIHVDGENLLTDPGRGLYNRDYFSARRYQNIFANSYGHSVPRIGGQLQSPGRDFAGELLEHPDEGAVRRATVSFGGAYPIPGLEATRQLSLATEGDQAGVVWLEDTFHFSADPAEVEEAFITWADVTVDGVQAMVRGERHGLRLVLEAPQGARFAVEALEQESRANAKAGVLKRLSVLLPVAQETGARLRVEVV